MSAIYDAYGATRESLRILGRIEDEAISVADPIRYGVGDLAEIGDKGFISDVMGTG